jgi:hypothetical protein
MNKLMPTMLNENSLAARMLRRPMSEPLSLQTRMPIPRLPPFRGMRYEAKEDPRRSGAYQGQSRFFMIVDDIDYPDPPLSDVRVKYWDIVPNPGDLRFPMPARHTKRFIYGENWIAYHE